MNSLNNKIDKAITLTDTLLKNMEELSILFDDNSKLQEDRQQILDEFIWEVENR